MALWRNVPGKLECVAVGSDGAVWGVDAAHAVFRLDAGGWTRMPGQLAQIAVGGAARVWGVNPGGGVYHWGGSDWVPDAAYALFGPIYTLYESFGDLTSPQRQPWIGLPTSDSMPVETSGPAKARGTLRSRRYLLVGRHRRPRDARGHPGTMVEDRRSAGPAGVGRDRYCRWRGTSEPVPGGRDLLDSGYRSA